MATQEAQLTQERPAIVDEDGSYTFDSRLMESGVWYLGGKDKHGEEVWFIKDQYGNVHWRKSKEERFSTWIQSQLPQKHVRKGETGGRTTNDEVPEVRRKSARSRTGTPPQDDVSGEGHAGWQLQLRQGLLPFLQDVEAGQ